ncbi:uncharacterized protein LOC114363843 isoform X2 [Ostrinia furnacalis]|uniref:uncharacterized protein LOC114363843 isoform X2 n=1 Tax=Ostrinia furnacalis TaxID=93504 RepID=UPI00103D5101|nr:uncharacterized protein LOC114363843 isoform X2 [Ostrinia furnacalis]
MGEISVLLGCDIFFQVLQRESLPVTPNGPFLVNTLFGYVVAGSLPVSAGNISSSNVCVTIKGYKFGFHNNASETPFDPIDQTYNYSENNCKNINDLEKTMSNFWECEKVPVLFTESSSEQQLAEEIFLESVKLENNRFSVALPLKQDLDQINLGDSLHSALLRLYNLEKRFSKDPELFVKYKDFFDKYLADGHGKYFDISNYDLNKGNVYFLPHHPVLSKSKTTPVRAVFDASMNAKNKVCLNDLLLNGPTVQKDLFDILILLRTYKYVLLCDIKSMYRQVLIENKFCCLQNILWRESPHDPFRCIQLQTVTYGLKSSSFLATRCLIELAQRYKNDYPLASFALLHSSYVDDIQCGSNQLSELEQIKNELIKLLGLGGFSLHKWCSNQIDILSDIPSELHSVTEKDFDKINTYIKTLGLSYDLFCDMFKITCPEINLQESYTKRQVLSFISKFFDPLGLVGPIFTQAKVLMQQLWFENLKWDEVLPAELHDQWVQFVKSLIKMHCISVPRNINTLNAVSIELIGFCDASNKAYGCCLYLRVIDADNVVRIMLLCSKSRINPRNKCLTTPRLELNSALLLAILATKVHSILTLKYEIKTFLYSDSQIVLSWLGIEPAKLSVYVSNRVEKIRQLTSDFQWSYVSTNENPADCLSRGVQPCSLQNNLLWWNGPSYLKDKNYKHCKSDECVENVNTLPEIKMINVCKNVNNLPEKTVSNVCTAQEKDNCIVEFLNKYSDIDKMTRIMAYMLRFVHNCKIQNKDCKLKGFLTPKELKSALCVILKIDQERYFHVEINNLLSNMPIKTNIASLNPFVDAQGLLRVGGRLQNAVLSFTKKHPIILSKDSNITKLIILQEHLRLLHAGQKLVLSSLSENYWIVNANRVIKSVLYKCIICFKLKAKNATQLMGSLPLDRVQMTRPFQIVGTDYGGPFYVKQSRIRKPVITKAYIVIFVCFVTKAIHIELASDMSTNTFLACLKRFIARRNKPTKIYCDNAANYKGANNVMKDLYKLFDTTEHQNAVMNYSNSERITFHFIPSYSPVFGGLWEAGIKSVKHHMKRVIGDTVLTYEEMYTVVVQIESILNSRPITPMSRDPEDMSYLTPGHFLTGSPLITYPEINVTDEPIGRLSFLETMCKNATVLLEAMAQTIPSYASE